MQGDAQLAMWTRYYATEVATLSSGNGQSSLDNASAACSYYMIRKGMNNPFHHVVVKDCRKGLMRAHAQIADLKIKAGWMHFTITDGHTYA